MHVWNHPVALDVGRPEASLAGMGSTDSAVRRTGVRVQYIPVVFVDDLIVLAWRVSTPRRMMTRAADALRFYFKIECLSHDGGKQAKKFR
jgi:hypothetical protein